jgi:lipopolysaccharide heptosyltransferase II
MNILIIRFSSLGDIILTESVVSNLRKKYPQARIDYLTKPLFADIVKLYFSVDNVYTDYKKIKDLRKISKNRYDMVIDLHGKLNSFIAKTFITSKKKASYNKKRGLRKKIVNHSCNQSIDSTVDLYFTALHKLNIPTPVKNPHITMIDHSNFLPNKNKKNIVIFPGATHETKRIPTNKIIELLKKLDNEDINFYLMGSKGEKDLTSQISNSLDKSCYDLAGKFNLVELIEAISEADFMISNDSGPMHIGAALGLSQIAFFGSTNTRLGFRPLNEKASVISLDLDCSPCTLHGTTNCPKKHFNCMNKIDIDNVAKTIIKQL